MAAIDVQKGWGILPKGLRQWACRSCGEESDVIDWSKVSHQVNQLITDCRQCPKCKAMMWSCGDTIQMHVQQEKNQMRKAIEEAAKLNDDPKEKPAEGADVTEEQVAGEAAVQDGEESVDLAPETPVVEGEVAAEGEGEEESEK